MSQNQVKTNPMCFALFKTDPKTFARAEQVLYYTYAQAPLKFEEMPILSKIKANLCNQIN